MTFQIGFTTPTGVLIASDRKKISLAGFHHSQIVPKIKVNENKTFAYCSAGDSAFGDVVASVVEEEFARGKINFTTGDPTSVAYRMIDFLKTARERESEYIKLRRLQPSLGARIMFVFRQYKTVALWDMDALSQIPTVSLTIEGGNIKSGDTNSPSVFFPHWYFDRVPNTVNDLIPLAVHTVLMAKSNSIEGVEVGVFTPTGNFGVLTDKELEPYIKRSKTIDAEILKLLVP